MNLFQMNSLLNMSKSIENIKTLNSVDVKMQGQKGVLETEIKHDKENGVDTSAKEQQLEGINNKHNSIQQSIIGIADDINKESEKVNEAGQTETDEMKIKEETENDKVCLADDAVDNFELELNGKKVNTTKNISIDKKNKKINVLI